MSKLHFAMKATPGKHAQLVRDINAWKYEVEGDTFKGTRSPTVEELKFYEVTVPESLEGQVARDLQIDITHKQFNPNNKVLLFMLYTIYKLVLLLSPYGKTTQDKGESKFSFTGSEHTVVPFGKLK